MTIYKGKTSDEAIALALEYLKLNRDQVQIKIIQPGRSGFLGIGRKEAIVDVTEVKNNDSKTDNKTSQTEMVKAIDMDVLVGDVKTYLTNVMEKMGFTPTVSVDIKYGKDIYMDIVVKEESRLIGHHGKTINAIQGLGQIFINRKGGKNINLILDSANYRSKRLAALIQLADKTARNAIASGKPVYLNPMNAQERKIIHNSLKENGHISTYSTGKEPHRVIVVAPR